MYLISWRKTILTEKHHISWRKAPYFIKEAHISQSDHILWRNVLYDHISWRQHICTEKLTVPAKITGSGNQGYFTDSFLDGYWISGLFPKYSTIILQQRSPFPVFFIFQQKGNPFFPPVGFFLVQRKKTIRNPLKSQKIHNQKKHLLGNNWCQTWFH